MPSPSKRPILAGVGKSYRGGIIENCLRFKFVGGGYKSMPPEQGGQFQIQSARHIAGPMRALVDALVRFVHVIGATQVLKSMIGDAWVIYVMEHVLLPMLVLFEDEGKADLYCSMRLMETIRKHDHIASMLVDAKKENRHAVQGTWIKTLLMELLVAGLNDGNVSSIPWPLIWVSEAWQHGSDGLLWKAFKRSDRFPKIRKILNESQASMAGTDLHRAAKGAHQVPLIWQCMHCDGDQTWEWRHWSFTRPEDFKPRETKKLNIVTIGGEPAIVSTPPKPGSYAGMRWIDSDDGKLDILTRASSAWWECIHCGSRIADNKPNRQSIMDTYRQDYLVEVDGIKIPPEEVCFTLPFESARDNLFKSTVKNYLDAKDSDRMGIDKPLQNWFMAERAIFFDPTLTQPKIITTVGSYDPKSVIENEHHRGLIIDVQKDLILDTAGTFWYEAYVADKSGNSFQLERGFATSWGELDKAQARWKIPNHYVCIDGRKWTPEILKQVAIRAVWTQGFVMGREAWAWNTWKVLFGDVARQFPWPDKQVRFYSPPITRYEAVIKDGKTVRVPVYTYRWSNLSFKDQLNVLRQGGEGRPKFMALPRKQLSAANQLKETGDLAYENQMSAEARTEKGGKASWEKIGGRPNHYWDVSCMRLVRMAMDGLAGHFEIVAVAK